MWKLQFFVYEFCLIVENYISHITFIVIYCEIYCIL